MGDFKLRSDVYFFKDFSYCSWKMCGKGLRAEEGRPLRGNGSHLDHKYGLELGGRRQKWGEVIFVCLYLVFIAAHGLSLVVTSRGFSLVVACRLLIVAASLVVEHRL